MIESLTAKYFFDLLSLFLSWYCHTEMKQLVDPYRYKVINYLEFLTAISVKFSHIFEYEKKMRITPLLPQGYPNVTQISQMR